MLHIEGVENLFKGNIISISTFVNLLTALSNHGVNETLIYKGTADSFSCSKINKIFEAKFESIVKMLSQIMQNMLCFILRHNNRKFLKNLLNSLDSKELIWHVLELFENDRF